MKTELSELPSYPVVGAAQYAAPADYGAPQDGASRSGRLRRLAPRVPVSIRGLLYKGQTHQTTRIVDLSVGGAGLEGATGIVEGDEIVIELLNKRQLKGKVMWWLAGRCGIAFADKLEPDDPMFRRQRLDIEHIQADAKSTPVL